MSVRYDAHNAGRLVLTLRVRPKANVHIGNISECIDPCCREGAEVSRRGNCSKTAAFKNESLECVLADHNRGLLKHQSLPTVEFQDIVGPTNNARVSNSHSG